MKRHLTVGIRLAALALMFAACPLFAGTSGTIKAQAIQVEMIHSDEVSVPAEFQVALYENLVHQLEKQRFQHVYRDGDRNAAALTDLVILHSTVLRFKEGSERARQEKPVAGATSFTVRA